VKQQQALHSSLAPVGTPVAAGFTIFKTDHGNFVITSIASQAAAIRRLNVGDEIVSFGNRFLVPSDSLEYAAQLLDEQTNLPAELVVIRRTPHGSIMRLKICIQGWLVGLMEHRTAQDPSLKHRIRQAVAIAPPENLAVSQRVQDFRHSSMLQNALSVSSTMTHSVDALPVVESLASVAVPVPVQELALSDAADTAAVGPKVHGMPSTGVIPLDILGTAAAVPVSAVSVLAAPDEALPEGWDGSTPNFKSKNLKSAAPILKLNHVHALTLPPFHFADLHDDSGSVHHENSSLKIVQRELPCALYDSCCLSGPTNFIPRSWFLCG
jgi:hypothetical protein